MVFDKEFVSHLTNYINGNDFVSKKYLNAYHMKFNDILNINDGKRHVIDKGYRFWNFTDFDIISFLFDKEINIKASGFMGYFSNISNTKNMIKFLEIYDDTKLFYLIEERQGMFFRVCTPLENIDRDEYEDIELKIIDETLEKYRSENEYATLRTNPYKLKKRNIKAILIHERLSDLLDLKDVHKFVNGYVYVPLTDKNLYELKTSEAIKHLINSKYKINDFGAILLDKYYNNKFVDVYRSEEEEEEEDTLKEEVVTTPIMVKFKSNI